MSDKAKIAELEEQVRRLTAEVEYLRSEMSRLSSAPAPPPTGFGGVPKVPMSFGGAWRGESIASIRTADTKPFAPAAPLPGFGGGGSGPSVFGGKVPKRFGESAAGGSKPHRYTPNV